MEDLEILARLREQRQEGLDGLMDRYGGLIWYIVRGILADSREQEECVSDIQLKLWQEAERFDSERGTLSTWLTAIARNTALNRLKALQRREGRRTELDETLADPAEGPEEALLRRERAERLRRAMEKLSATDRTLFYRKYYYLQSTAQIAAELGVTERTVEGRLYRLRKRLKERLGGEFDG